MNQQEESTMSKFAKALAAKRIPSAQEKIRTVLDDESYKDFLEAMDNPEMQASSIHRALKDLGVDISAITIQRLKQK
jgi:uncharacterized protein (DUF1778 family)